MMFEFTKEQETYIDSDINSHVFLEACPGSGKTEVVAAKFSRESNRWGKFPGGMAVLSFANSATDELRNRVLKHQPISNSLFPNFLGTFDSFIYKNIVNPISNQLTDYKGENGDHSIRIVENTSKLGFRTRWGIAGRGNIHAHHFSLDLKNDKLVFYTGDVTLDRVLNAVTLKDWQENDLRETKKRMLGAGYATYKDIECLAIDALTNEAYLSFVHLLSKRYPLIIVDECQDLSFEQLLILQNLSNFGVKLHFVGDLHQAIYGFREVEPEAVSKFVNDNGFTQLKLTRNFRSCQKIIDLCGKLTGRSNIIGQLTQLEPACYLVQYDNCPTEIVGTFKKLSKQYKNNVIAARGHSILQKFHTSASNLKPTHKLALSIKLFNPQDMEELEKSLTLYSEFIRSNIEDSVKPNSFNCPQGVDSNLKWRRFLFFSLSYFTNNSLKNMDITWSNWIRSIKPFINELSGNNFVSDDIKTAIVPLDYLNFISPKGQANDIVSTSLGQITDTTKTYRKATIHGIKGETHDVTMLISTARAGGQQGSHWSSWLNRKDHEAARFAYVASSRPQHRLIWAVKSLSDRDVEQFRQLGFHVVD